MSVAVVQTWHDWDFAAAEPSYRKALELSPRSPEAHLAYALHLGVVGRAAEGAREAERAIELNPVSLISHLALADRLGGLHPDDPAVHFHRGHALQLLGREEEAFRAIARFDAMMGVPASSAAAREVGFRKGGMRGYWLVAARQDEPAGGSTFMLAQEFAMGGDFARAVHWIEEGVRRREAFILWMATYPMFAPLQEDARYRLALKSMGLPGY